MVAIPPKQDPVLMAIDSLLEQQAVSEPKRDYIGASSIGDPCARKLWYRLHRPKEVFDASTLRRFLDGHRTEELIISWLEQLPFLELHTRKGDGKQYGFMDNRFGGHYDGIIRGLPQAPKTWHILEIKCVNEKRFNELKKMVVENEETALSKWSPEYYGQAVTYMARENMDRHYMIVATPGGRDLTSLRTKANNEYAAMLEDKARKILAAKEQPARVSDDPKFYQCRWCNFRDECHG